MFKIAPKSALIASYSLGVLFPLFFLVKILSFLNEDVSSEISSKSNVSENNCSTSSILVNATFAVILAAMWNAKKMIKIGTI